MAKHKHTHTTTSARAWTDTRARAAEQLKRECTKKKQSHRLQQLNEKKNTPIFVTQTLTEKNNNAKTIRRI